MSRERLPEPITEPCRGPGCDRPARASGCCWAHYKQLRKYGRLFLLNRYQPSILPDQEAA